MPGSRRTALMSFAIVIDRPDTITAWDIEAYDLGQTEQDRRNASPRPPTSCTWAASRFSRHARQDARCEVDGGKAERYGAGDEGVAGGSALTARPDV